MTDHPPWGSHALTATDPHALPGGMPHAGDTGFLRCPWRRELAGLDVAVVGVWYHPATTHRPGAGFGPRAARR